jgi:glutaminyl-tRNA synthetase
LDAINNPEDPSQGTRKVPFSRELYIEREDFQEVPEPKFFRLSPGKEVRLRYAYFVKCESVVKDPISGEVEEVHCTYDPATRGGDSPDGRKVKATLHWVSAKHAQDTEVRLYDNLFTKRDPEDVPEGMDFKANLNPRSLEIIKDAKIEPSLKDAKPGNRYQFERLGYFYIDPVASKDGKNVFNRTVTLKDTFAKNRKI